MAETDSADVQIEKDIMVSVLEATEDSICPKRLSQLEFRVRPPVYSLLYGPYRQHQLFVDCVAEVKRQNGLYAEMTGRLIPLSPGQSRSAGQIVAQALWLLSILLPFVFIAVGCWCYNDWTVCGCSVTLCLLIALHSITVFLVLHNSKLVHRLWFVHKVDLQNYFDRENSIVEVTLETVGSVQFLSAGQRGDVISRLARNPGRKAVLMVCARTFWISRILHPLLCLMLLIILCLIALIVDVDMIRQHHSF